MEWCLDFFKTDAAVIDPYMGSGSSGVACARRGQPFIGCEIDPEFFQTAKERIMQARMQPMLEVLAWQPT
jgi:DNA modification methylase